MVDTAYTFADERSNCGVGVLMNLDGTVDHRLVEDGFTVLENLDHRGARGAEPNTGDGAGMLIQVPRAFFEAELPVLADHDRWAVGQLFLPAEDAARGAIKDLIAETARECGYRVLAWRPVPTDGEPLGRTARATEPAVVQCFIAPPDGLAGDDLDRGLYVLRKQVEAAVAEADLAGTDRTYVCSLDRHTIVYKGLLTNAQLRVYYPELSDERVRSSIVFVHSRFSTNTLGAWELAHPYRGIVHNGEINTLRGNLNWMRAREADLASPDFGEAIEDLKPITHANQSDTAVLDNVLELLVKSGRSIPHAVRMLVPEAWEKNDALDPDRRAWYRYHATINEPWDGPALVAVTDGTDVGAILDRNGLRPCRYYVTEDDRLVMASETGVLDEDPASIVEQDRLQPGQLFYVDGNAGRIVPDDELFADLTDPKYADWLAEHEVDLAALVTETEPVPDPDVDPDADLLALQRTFGYTLEHVRRLVGDMAVEGRDPVGAMGNDTPLSVLSNRNKTLFTYFKQLFAQVSNPPIDYIREDLVTSLEHHFGRQRNLLGETPEHCRQVAYDSPILDRAAFSALTALPDHDIPVETIDLTYEPDHHDLAAAVERIRTNAVDAIEAGAEVLILDDREVGPDRVPIPSLLATAGIHHHLVRTGHRTDAGLVVASGQPCAVHHFCTLLGYGADAIYPALAYASIDQLVAQGDVAGPIEEARATYRHAAEHGIQKVMAKMGISTLESYKGAQIFEAVGLDADFVAEYFEGTQNRTQGIGIADVERDLRERHEQAFDPVVPGELALDQGGELYWRRDGEFHQWNPHTIGTLQYAARSGDYDAYREFATAINDQDEHLQSLRGMLAFRTDERESIPIEEVESEASICRRFFTGSMSFGSLSAEAHETLAIAMNRLDAMAGSGEGGEPAERFGTERECSNKQVASGRFGVTSEYLVNAEHLEIKMAQGSKPGEGGHLPGEKVNEVIADTRKTTPGVPLISPPPHHDIYSIEDLAQLIHDLKCGNEEADIHVKLVSEDGVGVIAAGVAKAKADAVLISGQDGGTGASPKTSIKSAGLPWELGLAEAHALLLENRLRSRIRVRVDGGLKTGRDVVVAAMLGAEEYGFGTAPLVTCGCIMLRKCHCNTCSVGIATQDPELREKFPGKPEYVVNYMRFIAREVREHMASLGIRTMDELIGRADLLETREVDHPRARHVDLSTLLAYPEDPDDAPRKTRAQHHGLDDKRDHDLIERAWPAIDRAEPVEIDIEITNRDRTFGTMLGAEITREHGPDGLPADTIDVSVSGTAGQSFGAFLPPGITFRHSGAVNDYCGKGLSGGKLIVRTPDEAGYAAAENILAGNVALYGATAGELYVNGRAGERFAVRNSGAYTVVEGVGDHGCEYMTGGVAVVLGSIGRNFGAGMSGGEAYVFDPEGITATHVNADMVSVTDLDERDRDLVRQLVENHAAYTDSERARAMRADWDTTIEQFVKVMPDPYASVIEARLDAGEDIRLGAPAPASDVVEGPQEALSDD